MKLYETIKNYLAEKLILKSSLLSMSYSFMGIVSSLITVSLLVNFLGEYKYGIWVTIYSISTWIVFLDGGFGNGLRNELAKDLVTDNFESAKRNITTAYISISLFLVLIFLIYVPVHFLIDWNEIFKLQEIDFTLFTLFIFSFFILQMMIKLISKVFFAFNKASLSFLIPALCNIIILLTIVILTQSNTENGLWYIAAIYSITPIVLYLFFTIWFFGFYNKEYRPRIKHFNKKHIKNLLSKGSALFITQINSAVIQTMIPFLITTWFSPDITANYHISLRYYSFVIVVLNIVLQNLWTPITKVYYNRDFATLNQLINSKIKIVFFFAVALCIMWFFSQNIYALWISRDFEVIDKINNITAIYIFVLILNSTVSNFLRAINRLRILSFLSVMSIFIFLPMAYIFVKKLQFEETILIIIPSVIMFVYFIITFTHSYFVLKKINTEL